MLYAALGDSITYGYSSTHDDNRFVSQIQRSIGRQQPVNLLLQAKPGWTTKQLLKSLSSVPDCLWDEARLVTILIGGNDLLHATPWLLDGNTNRMIKLAERYRGVLSEVVQRVNRPQAKVIVGTLYNPFPNSVLAEEYTELLNKAIRLVATHEDVLLTDIRKLFFRREHDLVDGYRRGVLRDFRIIGNPIHPNDAGHKLIAQAFLRTYRRSVSKTRLNRQKHQ